jgi:hypothetical protein
LNYCRSVCRCVGKKWLFWFCEESACVSGKTKCAICAVGCLFTLTDNVLQLKEVGDFLPKCFCGQGFFFYHKSFCGAQCRQFLLGAVMGWAIEVLFFLCRLYCLAGQLYGQNKVHFRPNLLDLNSRFAV